MLLYFCRRIDSLVLTLFSYCRYNVYIHFIRQRLRGHRSGSNPKVENTFGRGKKVRCRMNRMTGTRTIHRSTVKMLEFTKVYPPFFSILPTPLRVLLVPTDQPSYECPTRISPFYTNRDSRIYQFICCTWSAAECDAKNSLSSLVPDGLAYTIKKYNYWLSYCYLWSFAFINESMIFYLLHSDIFNY